MGNEFWPLGDWLDIGGTPRQDINKVTEEAVQRIQEETKQAKQAHQQAQQDRKTNAHFAKFLSFLISNIQDEKIVSLLYELFFKTKHPKTGTVYLRKKINTIVVIWFFFPFYQEEAKKIWIYSFFQPILTDEPVNLTGYINYIKRLSLKYHDNIALDSELLLNFLLQIISHFKLQDMSQIDEQERENFILHIKNQLYS